MQNGRKKKSVNRKADAGAKRSEQSGRTKRNLIITAVLFVGAAGLSILGKKKAFADWYCETVYRRVAAAVGSLTSLVPFSIAEILLYAMIVFVVVTLVQIVRAIVMGVAACGKTTNDKYEEAGEHGVSGNGTGGAVENRDKPMKRIPMYLSRLVLVAAILAFLYVANCGILYNRTSFAEQEGFAEVVEAQEQLTQEERTEILKNLCIYLVRQVNAESEAAHVVADADTGDEADQRDVQLSDGPATWQSQCKAAREALTALQDDYDTLEGYVAYPKYLVVSRMLSVQQVTGVYSPFTIEANVNREIPAYNIPFTMCHELSHLLGFMEEQEANFIAFLACSGSDDAWLRYAGNLYGFVYAGNALNRTDPEAYSEVRAMLNETALEELHENNLFWDRFEGKVSEAHDNLNDAYLKANGQEEGIISYSRVVELMMAWYAEA